MRGLFWTFAFLFLTAFAPKKPAPVLEPARRTTIAQVESLAAGSACAAYPWKNRGKANPSYMKGMALVYAKQLCDPSPSQLVVENPKLGLATKDAAALYGFSPTLRNVYTLMIGSGMRESSGCYCCGRDGSSSNYTSENVEAGLFQTSWNSRVFSPELRKLFDKYKAGSHPCFLGVFKPGTRCPQSDLKNWGSGDGLRFQEISKSCPSFAAEYHAVMLRVAVAHYGPIKRKEAEFRPECGEMLKGVESLITPALCEELKNVQE